MSKCIWCGCSTEGIEGELSLYPIEFKNNKKVNKKDICLSCAKKLSDAKDRESLSTFFQYIQNNEIDYDSEIYKTHIKKLLITAGNILSREKGSEFVRKYYRDLIFSVNNNFAIEKWAFSHGFFENNLSSKDGIKLIECVLNNKGLISAMVLAYDEGVIIIETILESLSANLVESISDSLRKINIGSSGFVNKLKIDTLTPVGENKFYLFKKHKDGKKNPEESFYLLTKCRTCGQTNPTGVFFGKDMFLRKYDLEKCGNNNGWNYYSEEDLPKLADHTRKWNDNEKALFIKNSGIIVPENIKLNDINFDEYYCNCVNCGDRFKINKNSCFM